MHMFMKSLDDPIFHLPMLVGGSVAINVAPHDEPNNGAGHLHALHADKGLDYRLCVLYGDLSTYHGVLDFNSRRDVGVMMCDVDTFFRRPSRASVQSSIVDLSNATI